MSVSHGFSRGSSLSIFSGGTGSISDIRGFGSEIGGGGGSGPSGGVKVDELSDEELQAAVDEAKTQVRRMQLETQMFQGYYERMAHGGASWPDDAPGGLASQVGSRKGSTSMTIDSLSELGSESQTISQMEMSQSVSRDIRGRQRRSGSRTSLGSRGKSLKLSTEQKTVIALKEIERWEQRLSNFRTFAKQVKRDGLAEIEERALKLGETEKTRETLIKGLATTVFLHDGKKNRDRKKVVAVFDAEIVNYGKTIEKLKTKNRVTKDQKDKFLQKIKMNLSTSEVTGPIDFQQLQLENAELIDVLRSKNAQVIGGRNSISDTRKVKNKIRSKLDSEQAKGTALKKQIADNTEKWIPRLEKSLADLKDRIRALHLKNAEKSAKCEKFLKGTEEVPTLDGYIQMKLNLEKLRWREKVNERKAQIETLKRRNQMALERRQEKSGYEAKIHSTRPTVRVSKVKLSTTRATPRGSLFKGTTFDLMYSVPPTAI